jgi:hypothetical protein
LHSTDSDSPQLNRHSLSGRCPSDQSAQLKVPPDRLPDPASVTRSLPDLAQLVRPRFHRITVPGSFRSHRLTVSAAYEPGRDTSMTACPRLDRLAPGRHRFWRWVCPVPRVSPLNSQVAFVHRLAVCFGHRPLLEGFHGSCRDRVPFPARTLFFIPPFGVFSLADPRHRGPPEPPDRADTQ